MSDIIDDAQEVEQAHLQASLARLQNKKIERTGNCLFCDEPLVDKNGAFCDSYCREDYEKIQRVKNKTFTDHFSSSSGGLTFNSEE